MSGGAGEWELEYPIISGDSSRGPMFEPREMGGELMLQLFGKGGNAHYEPYWCELNGHAFNMYLNKSDKTPCVRFDLKEFRLYPAARGLPGKEVNTMSPMFGLVSRYHRMVLENGISEVPATSVFFFECSSDKLRDDWLKCYYINQEWAQRFSGLFYPRGSARVEYGEGVWRLKVASDNSVRYLKSSRLHVSSKTDGTIYKKGSKFGSAWKPRYAVLKGQCTLEYFSEKGGELLGKVNMADGRVVLVCNDTLTPPAGANAKEKLSNLRGKIGRRTSLAPLPQAGALTKEERQENLLWFAVMNPGRVWLFKAGNLEDLERWMHAIEDRCNDFKQMMTQVRQSISQAEATFRADPCLIRYKLHPLADSMFPLLERAAIPGRPMSGVFNNEEAVKLSRTTMSSKRLGGKDDDEPDFDTTDQESDPDFSRDSNLSSSSSRLPIALPAKPSGGRVSPPANRKELPQPGRTLRAKEGLGASGNKDASGSLGKDGRELSPRPGGKDLSSPRGPRSMAASPRGALNKSQDPKSRATGDDELDAELDDALDVEEFEGESPAPTPRGGARSATANKAPPNKTVSTPALNSRAGAAAPASANADLLREKDEQLEEKVEQLEKIREQFNTMKEEYRTNKVLVKKQEREIEQLQADLKEAQEAAQAKSGPDEATAAELDEARKQLATEAKKSARLEAQVKRLQAENDKLAGGAADEGELEELKSQIATLEERNASLDAEVDALKRAAKESAKSVSELERERKKREALDARVATLQADLERVEGECEAANEAKHALEDQLASAKGAAADPAEVKALRKKLAVAELRVTTAETEATRAREAAAAAARRKDYSGIRDEEMREVVRALNEENDALVAQLGALKTSLAAQAKPTNTEIVALQRDLQLALKTLDIASDRLNKMEMENLALKRGGGGGGAAAKGGGGGGADPAELARLVAENAKLEQTIDALRKEIAAHLADKAEFEATLIAMQEEQSNGVVEEKPKPAAPVAAKKKEATPAPKEVVKPTSPRGNASATASKPAAGAGAGAKVSGAAAAAAAAKGKAAKPVVAVKDEDETGFDSEDPFAADAAVAKLDDVDDW